jgi:alpha-glucuronidase
MESAGVTPPSGEELGVEGFFLRSVGENLFVVAKEGRGLIYGVGRLLHTAKYGRGSTHTLVPEGIDRRLS